jgi:gamma-glutamyltranspeptidase / glutathione hydrolase
MRPNRRVPKPKAMIVAPQPEAVEAGRDILARGGSAVDAVLACAFTQGVVDPMMCGIGGLGIMQVFDPKTGRHVVFDGLAICPAGATPDMWEDAFEGECSDGYGFRVRDYANEYGHKAVGVPGIVSVLAAAHADFGRLPWSSLFSSAIGWAESGWTMRPHVHTMITQDYSAYGRLSYIDKIAYTAEGAEIYLHEDKSARLPGEVIHNPKLAESLKILADEGADAFYRGKLGQAIARDMQLKGGLITIEDLTSFSCSREKPLEVSFRGFRVAMPPPPAGGVMVGEILRILENFDLVSMGHNSPAYIQTVSEAMKIAGRDKDNHIGDPRFVEAPLDRLLSKEYAAECAERIRRGERTSLPRVGGEPKGTTTISCVDSSGMVVSITHTLGLPSGVMVPGTGFMLNGAMNWYDPRPGRASSLAPGKKRYSSLCPTLVFDGDVPVLSIGAPGGSWITVAVLQVLLNVLEWGMGIQEAILAPRFSATSDVIDIANRIPFSTEAALREMGYDVRRSPQSYPFAAVHGISVFGDSIEGGADPQRDGYAAGI